MHTQRQINPRTRQTPHAAHARQRGAAAVLAMMFLVIFASLATAMAIVSQGNLRTADSHLRMNRAMAAADTGAKYLSYRLSKVLKERRSEFTVSQGEVDATIAAMMWEKMEAALAEELIDDGQEADVSTAGGIEVGPIRVSPDEQLHFRAVLVQHPIPNSLPDEHLLHGHRYGLASDTTKPAPFYDRDPYQAVAPLNRFDTDLRVKTGIYTPVNGTSPLDARYVRLVVQGIDGAYDPDTGAPQPSAVTRTISMDLRLDKRLRAALLSKSRVQIGRNVMIEGRIGSAFMDTHLENGHPVQMESDFRGLDEGLDDLMDLLIDDPGSDVDLRGCDANGDNRLNVAVEVPAEVRADFAKLDVDQNGFVDDFDLFFKHFDADADGKIGPGELMDGGVSEVRANQLVTLIDTFHDDYLSSNEGVIDFGDRYAKVKGGVSIRAAKDDWEGAGNAAGETYYDDLEGPIDPNRGDNPIAFESDLGFDEEDANGDGQPDHPFQRSFDVSAYRAEASGDLGTQTTNQAGRPGVDGKPAAVGSTPANKPEPVPYGSDYPYDHYDRPVYENMTYRNLFIPKGTNALFRNCVFKGVTYIETHSDNFLNHPTDSGTNAYNYSGTQESDGSTRYPDVDAKLLNDIKSIAPSATSTKKLSNNIRFDGCRFEGPVVSGSASGAGDEQPERFSNTRNKLTFTSESGPTEFPAVEELREQNLISDQEFDLYRRGRLITPHMSVEMGSFDGGAAASDNIKLSGIVVAGVLDLRGNVRIDGSIITTYEPKEGDGTVLGTGDGLTTPQFNTTLGYFGRDLGDLETDRPDDADGWGIIQVKYDPTLPLPPGVLLPVQIEALTTTYYEGAR